MGGNYEEADEALVTIRAYPACSRNWSWIRLKEVYKLRLKSLDGNAEGEGPPKDSVNDPPSWTKERLPDPVHGSLGVL